MRRRIGVLLSVAVVAAGITGAVALAKPVAGAIKFEATLTAAQEVPKPHGVSSNAGGTFTATLNGKTMQWKLTFKGLTGAATQAHIHLGSKGRPGPVLIALCGAGCRSPVSGATIVSPAVVKTLETGATYVNVHTAKNPAGEIRGQLLKG
jgi:hypothetical protein